MNRWILFGLIVGFTIAIIFPVYHYRHAINQPLIGNYLFAGLIIEGIVLFLFQNHVDSKRRIADKKEKHITDLVDIIYSRLLTLRVDKTSQNRLQLQVERYKEWSPALNKFPMEALWMPVSHLPEPYLEFALKHLEAYEDIHALWEDIKRQVKEANSEHLNDEGRVEWMNSLTNDVLPIFTEKIRNLVNDLNAGIELQGKCRRENFGLLS